LDVQYVDVGDTLLLGLLDPYRSGTGFDVLRFQGEKEGVSFLDVSFDELGDAIAFFDDQLLYFDHLRDGVTDGVLDLRFTMEATISGTEDSFGTNFLVSAVPLPATARFFLTAFGVVAPLTRARRRTRLLVPG
jgi:hypothetical protein